MDRLEQIASQIESKKAPPVDKWKPEHEGEIDISIDVNGNWFHEGDPISRPQLVSLFSSILWCESEIHYLVTPAEKLSIRVADVPYIIQQAELVEGNWVVTTNTSEAVIISTQNPVVLRKFQDQWVPYVNIRFDLWARVNRSIYYQWVEQALEQSESLELSSGSYSFKVSSLV